MGSYVPTTAAEREEMLAAIGLSSWDDLFRSVPAAIRLQQPLDLPDGKSELEVRRILAGLAAANQVFKTVFRGAGAYRHYIPAIVKSVTAKEEFVTAYTPYQAEISQGILQAIFEYQTMICELTGMEAANASVYDGATAAVEALAMCRERQRTKAVVAATVHPQVIETIRTYARGAGAELVIAPAKNGVTDPEALALLLDETAAAFYLQQPNFYGLLEDGGKLGEIAHTAGAKFIMGCNPIALGLIKTPAECGADIAVGEGQPLGMPLSFGGPYLGFMACTAKLMRKLPGRIVGETTDLDGKRAFVLTLQAREQHIRREKAASNICSNQALCALTASVYLAALGPAGLKEVAGQCYAKAAYAARKITELDGYDLCFDGPFFHEFVTTCPADPASVLAALEANGILGGYPLSGNQAGCLLWCVTEMNTKEEIDKLVAILKEVGKS
jgi:glycine dehydrogenase subunit 1